MSRAHDVMAWAGELVAELTDRPPGPSVAVVRSERGAGLAVVARPEQRRERTSPLTELAVLIASLAPQAAALAVPARTLDRASGDVVDRLGVVVGIDVTGGGNRMDAEALRHGGAGAAVRTPLEVTAAPTASLVFDAVVRMRVEASPWLVAAELDARGHRVLVRDDPTLVLGPPPRPSDEQAMAHVRDTVRRLSRELERRHRPAAPVERRRCTPGIPFDLPDGWRPASPV